MKHLSNKKYVLFIAFVGLLAPNVIAKSAYTLSFDQFVESTFKKNLNLLSQTENTKSKLASENSAFKLLLPKISVSSRAEKTLQGSTASIEDETSYSASVTLSQSIYKPLLIENWHKSKLNRMFADKNLLQQRQLIYFEVKKAWYELLTAKELLKEYQASLARLKQHQHNAELLYQNGLIWQNDILQAKVRVSRGSQTLFSNENRVISAKRQINLLMDQRIDLPFEVSGQLEFTPIKMQLKSALNYSLEHRLDLQQSELEIAIAKRQKKIAQAEMKPTLDLNLQRASSSLDAGFDDSITETSVGLSLNWNLWQWGETEQKVSAVEYDINRLKLIHKQKISLSEAEVHSVWLMLEEAQRHLKVLSLAMEQAQENFRVSQIRYKEQLGTSNDVLDAQDLLTQTRTDYVTALSQYLIAKTQLDFVIGKPVTSIGKLVD